MCMCMGVCVWSVDCQLTVGYAKSNTPVQATKGAFWPGLNLLAYTTYAQCVCVCVRRGGTDWPRVCLHAQSRTEMWQFSALID